MSEFLDSFKGQNNLNSHMDLLNPPHSMTVPRDLSLNDAQSWIMCMFSEYTNFLINQPKPHVLTLFVLFSHPKQPSVSSSDKVNIVTGNQRSRCCYLHMLCHLTQVGL